MAKGTCELHTRIYALATIEHHNCYTIYYFDVIFLLVVRLPLSLLVASRLPKRKKKFRRDQYKDTAGM